jgi:hypothetical protein
MGFCLASVFSCVNNHLSLHLSELPQMKTTFHRLRFQLSSLFLLAQEKKEMILLEREEHIFRGFVKMSKRMIIFNVEGCSVLMEGYEDIAWNDIWMTIWKRS